MTFKAMIRDTGSNNVGEPAAAQSRANFPIVHRRYGQSFAFHDLDRSVRQMLLNSLATDLDMFRYAWDIASKRGGCVLATS